MTIVVFNLFYLSIKSLISGTKCVFIHQDLQRVHLKLCVIMSNFYPLEVLGRGTFHPPEVC